ncbi:hypothetical protein DVH24_017060 [Malus domestica]|uniref:SANTA domain-containing protein n=1 Tax=Malus domestica TaxID=3750 RepID=A0A498IV17_MALDO|nr:hypothetical protein DVH24_017060 [Malus domestica]
MCIFLHHRSAQLVNQNLGINQGLIAGGFKFSDELLHEARREFSSAPISKRFDIFTLETLDGICVAIIGFISEQNTIENGIPSEVQI